MDKTPIRPPLASVPGVFDGKVPEDYHSNATVQSPGQRPSRRPSINSHR